MKTKTKSEPAALPVALPIPQILPGMVFTLESARITLALRRSCLPREIRLKRLRARKRAGKVFILGEDLLAWLRDGTYQRAGARVQVDEVA